MSEGSDGVRFKLFGVPVLIRPSFWIVAVLLGILLFGDVPDALTLFGAAIIIGAGLYLWRETGRVRQPAR